MTNQWTEQGDSSRGQPATLSSVVCSKKNGRRRLPRLHRVSGWGLPSVPERAAGSMCRQRGWGMFPGTLLANRTTR